MVDDTELRLLQEEAKGLSEQQRRALYKSKMKDDRVAVVLSIAIPGSGLIYLGKVGKGLVVLLLCWLVVPWLYGVWASYTDARSLNERIRFAIFDANPSVPAQAPATFSSAVTERTVVIQKEIVRVKCRFCGQLNDQLAGKCTSCGAPL